MNRWEIEKKIAMEDMKDPAFKKNLLSQPKEALKEFMKNEKEANPQYLDNLEINTYEEKCNEWMITIPFLSEELHKPSKAEIEKLADGFCQIITKL